MPKIRKSVMTMMMMMMMMMMQVINKELIILVVSLLEVARRAMVRVDKPHACMHACTEIFYVIVGRCKVVLGVTFIIKITAHPVEMKAPRDPPSLFVCTQ